MCRQTSCTIKTSGKTHPATLRHDTKRNECASAEAPQPLAVSGYDNGEQSAGMNFFERHSRETVSSGTVTRNCRGAPGGLSAIISQQLHSQIIVVIIDSNQGSTHENNSVEKEILSYGY